MKLHELDTLKQQDKAERVLETRLGQTVSFRNLSLRESRHMLLRVRGLINEHRSSAASHSSERDPAYLKLLMIESGLKGRLKEGAPPIALPSDEKYTQALSRVYGQQILRNPKFPDLLARLKRSTPNERDLDVIIRTGALPNHLEEVAPPMPGQAPMPGAAPVAGQPGQPGANPAAQMAARKKQAQDQAKQIDDQIRQLTQQKSQLLQQANQPMSESLRRATRRLTESEIQQAQVVLAAQDMVDQMQKVIEQISAMQFKDLPALADSIKNDPNMGQEQATQYQSAASAALTQLLQSVQQGKTALEGAQGILTGQAPVVPGEDDAANMAAPPEGDLGGDELNPDADVSPFDGGDEGDTDELGNAVSLGRERRGVAEAKKKGSKPDFLDVDKDGDKKEPFKKAVADKKKNPFAKKK